MRIDLSGWLYVLHSGFWLFPTIMGLVAIVSAFGLVHDRIATGERGVTFLPTLTMPMEGARLALLTIAASMISLTSLVFSMTLVKEYRSRLMPKNAG